VAGRMPGGPRGCGWVSQSPRPVRGGDAQEGQGWRALGGGWAGRGSRGGGPPGASPKVGSPKRQGIPPRVQGPVPQGVGQLSPVWGGAQQGRGEGVGPPFVRGPGGGGVAVPGQQSSGPLSRSRGPGRGGGGTGGGQARRLFQGRGRGERVPLSGRGGEGGSPLVRSGRLSRPGPGEGSIVGMEGGGGGGGARGGGGAGAGESRALVRGVHGGEGGWGARGG